MKDWFNKLKDAHKLMLMIGSFIAVYIFAGFGQFSGFFYLLCVACLFFTCIFTVYFIQSKIADKKKKTSYHKNLTAPQSVSSDTTTQTEQPEKKTEFSGDFPKIFRDYFRRWQYRENIPYPQNLDKLELNDSDINLVPEPDNQYDPNAVALYKGEYKLGYLYKGQTQEMVLSYLDRDDYGIAIAVCLLDTVNNKLAVKIAFYRKIESMQLETVTVSLTRITKKAKDFASSRYENVGSMNVGDYVEISKNFDDRYTVYDKYWDELGELNATEKMEEIFDDIKFAKIADIQLDDNDAYKVKISIFY